MQFLLFYVLSQKAVHRAARAIEHRMQMLQEVEAVQEVDRSCFAKRKQ